MLFLVISTWEPKDRDEMNKRFAGKGQPIPDGVKGIGMWTEIVRCRSYSIVETDSVQDLMDMQQPWIDLLEIETIPIVAIEGVMEKVAS